MCPIRQGVNEMQPRGIVRPKVLHGLGGLSTGLRCHGVGRCLGIARRSLSLLRHDLIGGDFGTGNEGGSVGLDRYEGVVLGRRFDPDDQMRLPALGCEEGIDPAGLANQGDVGFDPCCNRFQERHIRRAGQMPVFGIPDNEIEDVFVLRQNDDGGVPHLRLNIDQLIDTGDRLDAQHGSLGPSRR